MDERTKELGSQLNSAAEESTEKNDEEKDEEEKIEDLEGEEDGEESENDGGKNEEKKDTADKETKETEEEVEGKKPEEEDKTKTQETSKTDKQDRWHGKSREEVIKSYEELEKQAEELKTGKAGKTEEPEKPEAAETKTDELEIPTDEELAKMTPKGFAEWMINTVGKMVDKTYETRGKIKDAVSAEIRDVQKDHPLLKTNPEYRDMILALIDAAAQKGTVMPLKDACVKVDTMIGRVKGDGNKVSDEDKARLKKAKAQVERGAGAPASTGEEKGAEQKRLESIFGTGRSKSPFGGLGV